MRLGRAWIAPLSDEQLGGGQRAACETLTGGGQPLPNILRTLGAPGRPLHPEAGIDVVLTAGQYAQVSMMLNTFGVQLERGQTLDPDLEAYVS